MPEHAEGRRGGGVLGPVAFCFAALASLAAIGLVEATVLPSRQFARGASLAYAAVATCARDAWTVLGPGAAMLLLLGLPIIPGLVRRIPRMASTAWILAVCAGLAVHGYGRLILDPLFLGYWPGIAAWVLVWSYLSLAFGLTLATGCTSRRVVIGRRVIVGVSVVALVAAHVFNHTYYPRLYPSLHLALFHGQLLLLHHALGGLTLELARAGFARALWVVTATLVVGVVSSLAIATVGFTGRAERVQGLVRRNSVLGGAGALFRDLSGPGRKAVAPDSQGVARFLEHSGLPDLPTGFDLTRYNVLFVSSEATRYDQTSLFLPSTETTPNLARLRDRGAFSMTGAYSPSSSTLQVMSAVMTMQYPSMVDLKLATRSWRGTLRRTDVTVAELFRSAGYSTVRVSHNHMNSFDRHMRGLGRGFGLQKLVPTPVEDLDTDARIVEEAIDKIGAAAASGRFFAWVFLVSPHWPYLAHDPQKPASGPLDLYRQELAYMDERMGELLTWLEASDLMKETVVIFVGDHGEEFREHGGTVHKTTVYSESLHVPMLIWVPGLRGRVMTKPTSTLYVFPWLLRTGTPKMRSVVDEQLRKKIGPMLRATDGAVVAELLGHDRMETALVYDRFKINYDFRTGATELFDLTRDRLEQDNVFGEDAETGHYLARMEAYRTVRSSLARFEYAGSQLTGDGGAPAKTTKAAAKAARRP